MRQRQPQSLLPAGHGGGVGLRSLLAAGVAGLAFATPAAAAPFSAGTGHDPQVAVGADGTGHVVWITDEAGGDRVGYCRVVRDGTSCARTDLLAFPGVAGAQATHSVPQAFTPADGRVLVVASCWSCGAGGTTNRTFVWTSADGGASFGAPVERGDGIIMAGQGAFVSETDTIVGIGGSDLLAMGDAPLATAPVKHTASAIIASPAVARVPGADSLVAVSSDMAQVRFARYAGPLTATPIDVQPSWTIDQPVSGAATASDESSLGSGPAGLFLAYRRDGRRDELRLHAYDSAAGTFDGGSTSMRNREVEEPDLTQSPDGDLALVWRATSTDGKLRYRRSASAGAFGPVAPLAEGETFRDPEIGADADDGGFVVWSGSSSAVRVLPLPDPPAATYEGRTRRVRSADRRIRYQLLVPRGCVHAGQQFTATLRWRERAGTGARVTAVDFRLGRAAAVADGSAPFRQTLTVPEFTELGRLIRVAARPTVRAGGDTVSARTARTRIRVCG